MYIRSRETPKKIDQKKDRSTQPSNYGVLRSTYILRLCLDGTVRKSHLSINATNCTEWMGVFFDEKESSRWSYIIIASHTHGPNLDNLGWNGGTTRTELQTSLRSKLSVWFISDSAWWSVHPLMTGMVAQSTVWSPFGKTSRQVSAEKKKKEGVEHDEAILFWRLCMTVFSEDCPPGAVSSKHVTLAISLVHRNK